MHSPHCPPSPPALPPCCPAQSEESTSALSQQLAACSQELSEKSVRIAKLETEARFTQDKLESVEESGKVRGSGRREGGLGWCTCDGVLRMVAGSGSSEEKQTAGEVAMNWCAEALHTD